MAMEVVAPRTVTKKPSLHLSLGICLVHIWIESCLGESRGAVLYKGCHWANRAYSFLPTSSPFYIVYYQGKASKWEWMLEVRSLLWGEVSLLDYMEPILEPLPYITESFWDHFAKQGWGYSAFSLYMELATRTMIELSWVSLILITLLRCTSYYSGDPTTLNSSS